MCTAFGRRDASEREREERKRENVTKKTEINLHSVCRSRVLIRKNAEGENNNRNESFNLDQCALTIKRKEKDKTKETPKTGKRIIRRSERNETKQNSLQSTRIDFVLLQQFSMFQSPTGFGRWDGKERPKTVRQIFTPIAVRAHLFRR